VAWEELKAELKTLTSKFTEGHPLWHVDGLNGVAFHAHPVFLDDIRVAGELSDLLTGNGKTAGTIIAKRRIVLDVRLPEAEAARKAMGITPDSRYRDVADLIVLLQHYDSVQGSGAVLEYPAVLVEGTRFADAQASGVQTAGEFVQLHGLYIAAVQDLLYAFRANLGPKPADDVRMQLVEAAYASGLKVAQHIGYGRLPLNAGSAWRSDEPGFAKIAYDQVAELRFSTVNALLGHAFKHRLRAEKEKQEFPGDEKFLLALVEGYQKDADAKIRESNGAPVTSAVAQLGTSRTYYFGTVTVHASMVAVNEAGEVWISTYYGPGRY
jgi:hypothetical protein